MTRCRIETPRVVSRSLRARGTARRTSMTTMTVRKNHLVRSPRFWSRGIASSRASSSRRVTVAHWREIYSSLLRGRDSSTNRDPKPPPKPRHPETSRPAVRRRTRSSSRAPSIDGRQSSTLDRRSLIAVVRASVSIARASFARVGLFENNRVGEQSFRD